MSVNNEYGQWACKSSYPGESSADGAVQSKWSDLVADTKLLLNMLVGDGERGHSTVGAMVDAQNPEQMVLQKIKGNQG